MQLQESNMIIRVVVLLALLTTASCASNTFYSSELDPATGVRKTSTYSKYLDAGDWIVKDKLGIRVVIDVEDLQDNGHFNNAYVTLYFHNFDNKPVHINVYSIKTEESVIKSNKKRKPLPPKSLVPWKAGKITIFTYAKEQKVTLKYYLNGKKRSKVLTLARRTPEDLKKYFGPGGKPPYPWIK